MEDFTTVETTADGIEMATSMAPVLRAQRNHTLRQVAELLSQGREGKLVAMVSAAQRYGDPPLAALSAYFTAMVDEDERPPLQSDNTPLAENRTPPSGYDAMNRNELVALCHERGITAGPTTKRGEAQSMLEEQDAEVAGQAAAVESPEAVSARAGESIRA